MEKIRNSNIELLRIISMFMVLILHALSWGGALDITIFPHFQVYWWMEALSVIAVDVFVLISGYFMVESSFKAKNVFKTAVGGLWIYSVIFGMLEFKISGDMVRLGSLVKIFFPITTKRFWFVNSYLALYILSPFINKMIHSLSKKHFSILVGIVLFLFSVRMTIFPMTWTQDASGGMGILSFVMLYLVAAWLRLYYRADGKSKRWLVLYFLMSLLLLLSKIVIVKIGIGEAYSTKLYGYSSIIVIAEAVALFLFFLNGKPLKKSIGKIINSIARHSFSVYIIHFSMLNVLFDKIIPLTKYVNNIYAGVFAVILSSVGVYVFCTLVDIIKCFVFDKCRVIVNKTILGTTYNRVCSWWDRNMENL